MNYYLPVYRELSAALAFPASQTLSVDPQQIFGIKLHTCDMQKICISADLRRLGALSKGLRRAHSLIMSPLLREQSRCAVTIQAKHIFLNPFTIQQVMSLTEWIRNCIYWTGNRESNDLSGSYQAFEPSWPAEGGHEHICPVRERECQRTWKRALTCCCKVLCSF